jgi:membrane protein required for colicin V production
MGNLAPTFTGFDVAVFVIILVSAIAAYARGFVREAFSLLAWAGACVATYYLFTPLKSYAREVIPVPLFADVGTGLAIFVVTLIVLSVIATNITRVVASSEHGPLNRAVGFLFGIVRGVLLVCFGYLAVSWIVPPGDHPGWMTEAKTMPLVREGASEIQRLIPHEVAASAGGTARRTEQRVRDAAEAERLLRGLNTPAPRAEPAPNPTGGRGYQEQDRRKLEDLVRGAEQR